MSTKTKAIEMNPDIFSYASLWLIKAACFISLALMVFKKLAKEIKDLREEKH